MQSPDLTLWNTCAIGCAKKTAENVFSLMHFRDRGLKQDLPGQCIHKSCFRKQIMGNNPEIIHFETCVRS